jgi:hypothetical protein
MKKRDLQNAIAKTGYNVGFGAKKNLASYDIISKVPTVTSLLVTSIGIIGLGWPELVNKCVSALLLIIGIIAFAIEKFCDDPSEFMLEGERENILFIKLKDLYFNVKAKAEDDDVSEEETEFKRLKVEFYSGTKARQLLTADWWAHYKFFNQYDIKWINDEIGGFKNWRDKFPSSLKIAILLVFVLAVLIFVMIQYCPDCP